MSSTVSNIASEKRSRLPAAIAFSILLLLILLLGFYLGTCLKKPIAMETTQQVVLGVSSFNTSASKNPVVNGESFTFNTTTVADANGIANATAKFDLSGQGVIDNNIHGPGTCVKITDATAVCNNVNVEANQTVTWTVPVTVKSNCSQSAPASLSFQAQLIAPVGTFTSTSGANCVASQQGTNPSPTSTPSSQGTTPTLTNTTTSTNSNPTGSNTTGGTSPTTTATGTITGTTTGVGITTGTGGQTGNNQTGNNNGANSISPANGNTGSTGNGLSAGQMSFADLVCYRFGNSVPLVYVLLILWLIAVISYLLYNKREQHSSTELKTEEKEKEKEKAASSTEKHS